MKKVFFWMGAGFAVGAVALWSAQRRRLPAPWSAWQPVLIKLHGEEEGRRIVRQAMGIWRELVKSYPLPLPVPPLRDHLVEKILPGLAIYRMLQEAHGGDKLNALAEIEPLFQAWTEALYGGLMRFFRLLPFSFNLFRLAIHQQMKGFPDDIWQTVWVEDSLQRVAMDHFHCPYVETLRMYGSPELAPFYCRIDNWMAEMLPPSIGFQRSQTLASGGDRCDFRYERIS